MTIQSLRQIMSIPQIEAGRYNEGRKGTEDHDFALQGLDLRASLCQAQ